MTTTPTPDVLTLAQRLATVRQRAERDVEHGYHDAAILATQSTGYGVVVTSALLDVALALRSRTASWPYPPVTDEQLAEVYARAEDAVQAVGQ